jgi:hypothetical protein
MDFNRLVKLYKLTEADAGVGSPVDTTSHAPFQPAAAPNPNMPDNPFTPPAPPSNPESDPNGNVSPDTEEEKAKRKEEEAKKRKEEKRVEKYKEMRRKLIDVYDEENKDTSYVALKPVKGSYRAIIPIFNMDVSTDPYLDKELFDRMHMLRKLNDDLDYNDIFVKDIEHIAKKQGIDKIEWKKDSQGSKYFEIDLGI